MGSRRFSHLSEFNHGYILFWNAEVTMKQLLVLMAIIAGASLGYGHANYVGYSGAPGSNGTCASSCHGTTGGTIQITDFPADYTPGQTYSVTISHSSGSAIRQFNGSCRVGTGSTNAGVIAAGTNTATYNTGGETNGFHLSSIDQQSGTFQWTAPAQGTGVVRLYIAGHQGGYSGQNTDLVLVANEHVVPVSFRKAPYLIYQGLNTEMRVLWQLDGTATCTIAWGTDTNYSMGSAQTTEYGNDHQHRHVIGSLAPGTKYYYRVTVGSESATGSFRTALPGDATHFKFLAYGDTRSDPAIHDQVAEDIVSTFVADPDFQTLAVVAGDLVTDGNAEADWDNELFDPARGNVQSLLANLPYQSAIGDHDGSGVLFQKYFPYPFVGSRYWSYDYGPAHFVVLDQYTDYSPGSAELQWFENDLATTDKLWKFVVLHEPGWSAGTNENNMDVQDYIQPLCEQYEVAIVFGGHNNYYARATVNNVQHITTGGGGAPLDTPNPTYPNIVATGMYHHFCKVEIDSSRLSFTAITPEGTVVDTFSITLGSTFVQGKTEAAPVEFSLSPAYPNPFNPTTTLIFAIPTAAEVTLTVFDITGRNVGTLVQGWQSAGTQRVTFDGSNLASGIYFARMRAGNFVQIRKMVLIK